MYIPASFAESDPEKLHAFIRQNSFGLLVSQHEGRPFATHLPLLLDGSAGKHGLLIGHMARANPQWRQADGQEVLAVFSGPHAYVSPTWYEAERVVPTWNYVAVHAYGRFRVLQDPERLVAIVRDTVRFYERSMPRPWTLEEADGYVRQLLTQVVGFHIEIDRIEGKWKLNQNQPEERRKRVIRALKDCADGDSQAIASLMEDALPPGEPFEP
jgi:transcriptional regulator